MKVISLAECSPCRSKVLQNAPSGVIFEWPFYTGFTVFSTAGKVRLYIFIIVVEFWFNMQAQEHLPHQWSPLAAHRADLTLGVIDICIFVAKVYGRMPFHSPTQTHLAVQDLHLYPTDLGCVLHRWHHELVVLFCWTTTTAPGSRPVDCEATVTQVVPG